MEKFFHHKHFPSSFHVYQKTTQQKHDEENFPLEENENLVGVNFFFFWCMAEKEKKVEERKKKNFSIGEIFM